MDKFMLTDDLVTDFLQKNEEIIKFCYNIPDSVSPCTFILGLINEAFCNDTSATTSKHATYSSYNFYSSRNTCCSFCENKLKVKKCLKKVRLYDDIFGTRNICILTKFCNSCKLTYYPGFCENYEAKKRFFDKNWVQYGIFVSTHCTAFSIDILHRMVTLKQKCHTAFMGRTSAYNMHHGYINSTSSDNAMDKRRLTEAYFKFILISFKERYSYPLQLVGNISDALVLDYCILHKAFQEKYMQHVCDVQGCKTVLVVDGHMKAHRKLCKENGCEMHPIFKSLFCEEHSSKSYQPRTIDEENKQQIVTEEEFHVEKIVSKSLKKKKWLYEVCWKGYNETTYESKENIPRILVELFEMYGDSTLNTEIESYFQKGSIKYVNIKVDMDTITLPACSLEVNQEAYYLPTPNDADCNTQKTKSRFYHRTGGILALSKPCGIIVDVKEIFGGESVRQVAETLEQAIKDISNGIKVIVYDDGCHLKKHVDKRTIDIYPNIKNLEFKIDRFHFPNHTDYWCKQNMDPSKSDNLKNVNTEVCEQIFAWFKGYAPQLRYMNKPQYNFIILDLLDRHNRELLLKAGY